MFLSSVFAMAGRLHGEPVQAGIPTTMPPVTVTGDLQEEAPTGAYGAPEWTGERRFPSTRVYLQQGPGQVGFEQWARVQSFRDDTKETRFQEELEFGLPYRFQIDLYETWAVDEHRRADQDEFSVEVRWALADWGNIPLNPTLYVEYATHNHAPNTIEGKLLLGEDLAPRWHWGLNVACEQEVSGYNNTEIAASQGMSYTIIDKALSAGVEMEFYHEKARHSDSEVEYLIGPSVQVRPTPWSHLDLVALLGTTHDSPVVEAYVVFGIDFGKGEERYTPVSLRSH